MRLSEFITSRTEIVQEWERFARTCLPAAEEMDPERLRNHSAELLPNIFDAFYKSESATEGRQGFGVGLWLSRQLIEMLGGEITAHSEGPGTGRVRLPLHQPNSA